jgi:UDP-N-acetylglucosamine--N-acetylmuramyl-(pentapeptide) pyrophosphoryl-undecaprenol N-acetylglucosamine transferase
VLPEALAALPVAERPQLLHQSGKHHLSSLQQRYSDLNVHAQCMAFIADMPAAYADADLVICRAGALTVAELAAAGVPSILVPFPHAVDDHQTANARFLSEAGAAILMPQEELSVEALAKLPSLGRDQLREMAEKARDLARPDAARDVANVCEELVK